MNLMEGLINKVLSGGSGQSEASSAVLYTQQALTPVQQAQARKNIQCEAAVKTIQVAGSDVVISPEEE